MNCDRYTLLYVDLLFERSGLFELIREKYHPTEVLYPGCSVHLTPAFFFPYVVFVDQDPAASTFFSSHENVLNLVNRQRRYRRTPYIQFISQDFTRPLPVPQNQFDLLLALYTGGVAKACKSYLKIGGLLLTNNHQNDALQAAQENDLTMVATIQMHRGKYRLVDHEPGKPIKISSQISQSRRYLKETSSGVEYIERESYYVFKRIQPPR